MSSIPTLKALGLNISSNPLELPPGSMTEASNVIIRRDDIIESRRGYKIYDSGFGTSVDRAKQLAVYKDRILVHYASKLAFEDGTVDQKGLKNFEDFSGTYLETEAGLRIKSIESKGNFYFTTSEGIKKISASSATDLTATSDFIVNAGVPRGLDFTGTPIYELGNQTGYLPADSAVAYRIVWASLDKNNILVRGAPSERIEVYNYLLTNILQDLSGVLKNLDAINQSGSLITNGNYVSTFNLPITATATQLRQNLIDLTIALDNDILIANGTGVGAPLTISSISINAGICTVTFSSSIINYFKSGDVIFISGAAYDLLNGKQTITNVTSTSFTFVTSALNTNTFDATNISVPFFDAALVQKKQKNFNAALVTGNIIYTSGLHNLSVDDPVFFTLTNPGSLPGGLVAGTTYYVQSIVDLSSFTLSNTQGGPLKVLSGAGSGFQRVSTPPLTIQTSQDIYFDAALISSNTITTQTPHNLAVNDQISFYIPTSGALPVEIYDPATSVGEYLIYYVKSVPTATSFTISSTSPVGATVTLSPGSGIQKFSTPRNHNLSLNEPVVFFNPSNAISGQFDAGTISPANTITTIKPHGLSLYDPVVFSAPSSGSLPVGLEPNVRYIVRTVPSPTTFTLWPFVNAPVITSFTAGSGTQTFSSNTLPSGISAGVTYYVKSIPSSSTFTLSTTSGGYVFPINLGSGIQKLTNGVITTNNIHGLSVNSPVIFTAPESGSLPTNITAGTTYYVRTVPATNKISLSTTVSGQLLAISPGTGTQTITSTQGNFSPSVTSINSYAFRNITQPAVPLSPPTHDQLVAIQTYLSDIITALGQLSVGVLSSSLKATYIDSLDVTNSSNVKLTVTIPEGLNSSNFVQVYRTQISKATGTNVLSLDVAPGDEMQLIYEAYPTDTELSNLQMIIIDSAGDAFLKAYLYTNAATGEASNNQPNAIPPFAKDINTFKNVTFYSNTKQKYSKNLSLVGLAGLFSDVALSIIPKLTIANEDGTFNTYSFKYGINQKTIFQTTSGATLAGTFFTINSALNVNKYYVWFSTGATPDPATLPGNSFLQQLIGVKVLITVGDSAVVVATKVAAALGVYISDFAVSNSATFPAVEAPSGSAGFSRPVPASPIQIIATTTPHNLQSGDYVTFSSTGTLPNISPNPPLTTQNYYKVVPAYLGTNKFAISDPSNTIITFTDLGTGTHSVLTNKVSVTNTNPGYSDQFNSQTSGCFLYDITLGQGEKCTQHTVQLQCATASAFYAGKYFLLSTPYDLNQYYVWFTVDGFGADPMLSNKTGIPVALTTLPNPPGPNPASLVASKIATALNTYASGSVFEASTSSDKVIIKNKKFGPVTSASNGNTGWSFTVLVSGGLDVLLATTGSDSQSVEATARSLVRVINKNPDESIYAFYTSSVEDLPGNMTFQAKAINSLPFYIVANSTNSGSSFNPDLSPTLTISSIIPLPSNSSKALVTTSSAHGLTNKDYVVISNSNCKSSIDGVKQIDWISSTQFAVLGTITNNGTTGAVIPASAAIVGENDNRPNRVYYSKIDQPEAVPSLNYFDVGARDKAILRIFPLRDTLFIFKEDGLYRISGESAPFTLALFDSSCIAVAPDSVAVCNNIIYVWTTQGISVVTESGVSIISRPIDTEVLKVSSSDYINFKTATFGIGYDSDNSYIVFTVKDPADMVATFAYRFSTMTNTWTTFDLSKTCGLIRFNDSKMYLGCADTNNIEQERKSFNRTDYADREEILTIPINGVSDTKLYLSNVSNISVGDVIGQEQSVTAYIFNSLLTKLDLDPGLGLKNYKDLTISSGSSAREAIWALAQKLVLDPSLSLVNFTSPISYAYGTISGVLTTNVSTIITSPYHGLIDGRVIQIQGTTTTPSINQKYKITYIDDNTFSIPTTIISAGTPSGAWQYYTLIYDIEDIRVCYNKITDLLTNSSGPAFSSYDPITKYTSMEAVVESIDRITSHVMVNLKLNYLSGDVTLYHAIKTKFTYSPNHFGDPLTFKHFREATLMFLNKAFTAATMRVGTDLLPQLIEIPFYGDGNGLFGYAPFGQTFFGGGSHPVPFRTYIPRQCQRCRYIVIQFEHKTAREQYGITGMTLTGEVYSIRSYR